NDGQTGCRGFHGLVEELFANIVDIYAGTQYPAPGFEQLNVGNLGYGCFMSGLGPAVFDGTGSLFANHADHYIEKLGSVRVLISLQRLPVEFRVGRVHDHARMQVVDPEIIIGTVAQLAEQLLSRLLSLLATHHALTFQT